VVFIELPKKYVNNLNNLTNIFHELNREFLKTPARALVFKIEEPNIPLPPEPILTREGTRLKDAFYYFPFPISKIYVVYYQTLNYEAATYVLSNFGFYWSI